MASTSSNAATPAPARGSGGRSALLSRTLLHLDQAREMAGDAGRSDLVGRLDQARERLLAEDVPVAVVGEFKQGKSTLVNALLRTDVCPVDSDVVTAVPTIVRYGDTPAVIVHVDPAGGEPADRTIPFDQLRRYVTERDGVGPSLRSVEVRLDRLLLRSGLTFIDTPGVGGLDSAQGNLTLAALPLARAALFVTDAAQELTDPELDFLRRTVELCPTVVCVVTKTDLYPEWRRIVDLNHSHLARAELNLPILPVSSFLRLRAAAQDSTALNNESGFTRLLAVLRRGVLAGADAATARAVNQDVAFVVAQLQEQVGAERIAARHPEASADLAERLAEKARRSENLASGSASWQTVLADGIQDLTADVEHDLRERLRAMLRRGEALLDAGDPKDTWQDFGAWAAREATSAAVDNLFLLVASTEHLVRDVAERFDLEYESLDLDLPAPATSLAKVGALDVRFDRSTVRKFLGALTAARVSYGGAAITYGGVVMFSTFGSLMGLAVAAPVGVALGVTVGRKAVREERERQVEYRRAQARQELRRYIDEVAFVVGKDSRDAVRRTQRFLRDEFAAHAAMAQRSSALALNAVRETAQVPDEERARRAEELDDRWRDLDKVADRVGGRPERHRSAHE